MWEQIKNEPIAVMGFVQAVIALLGAFGLGLTADQIAGVMTVTAAFLTLIVRQQVVPLRTLPPPTRPTGVDNAK